MSLDPSESMLDTGDYQRLGVRQFEARPRVIRHAAHQMAEPLVRRHLVTPDGQTESDLAQVVTSTYRLLDPRRRTSPVERALLTQPEPVRPVQTQWAHPKALPKRRAGVPAGSRFPAAHFESIPADGSVLFPKTPPPPTSASRLWIRRTLLHWRYFVRWLQQRWPMLWTHRWSASLGATAALLVLLVMIRPMLSGRAAVTPTGLPAAQPTAQAATAQPIQPSLAVGEPQRPAQSRTTPEQPPASVTPDSDPPAMTGAAGPDAEPPISSDSPASSEATEPPSAITTGSALPPRNPSPTGRPSAAAPARKGDAADDVAPSQTTPVAPEPPEQEPAAGEATSNEQPRAALGSPASEASPASEESSDQEPQPAAGQGLKTEGATPDDGAEPQAASRPAEAKPAAAPPRRAPLPSTDAVKQSQTRMQKLLADRPEAVTEPQQLREIEWLLDLRDESQPASADSLAIAQLAIAKLVTVGRYRQAAAIVDELEGRFDVQDGQLGVSTTEKLVDSAGSLSDHRRIVGWCLLLSERYLQAEIFDAASEMARFGTVSAVKLGDAELRGRLNQRRDAISTARRTADSVWRITEQSAPETATAKDATHAGRYLCLMIRDWEQGVPWLAQSSDPRLASAAQQELKVAAASDESDDPPGEDPANGRETGDWGTVAKQWLEACDRYRGRFGESAKLHAYELISRAIDESAGIRTLELKKQLDALREELPEELLPAKDETPAPAANRLAGQAAGPAAMAADTSIMEGRLTLAGRDTGVVVRYPPGVQLRQNAVDQIFQVLGQPLAPWTLTFDGVLRLDQATTVRFIAAGPTAPEGEMALRVDSNRLPLMPSVRGQSAKIDLPAGMHRVTWQLSGQKLDEAFLLVHDEATNERLDVAAPPAGLNRLPSRVRINIQRGP